MKIGSSTSWVALIFRLNNNHWIVARNELKKLIRLMIRAIAIRNGWIASRLRQINGNQAETVIPSQNRGCQGRSLAPGFEASAFRFGAVDMKSLCLFYLFCE